VKTEAQREAQRAWKKANPERHRELNRRWAEKHREQVKNADATYRARMKDQIRWQRIEMLYGLTRTQFEERFVAQGGRCACCGTDKPRGRNWHVDHDHKTKVVRGILCSLCNAGIGSLGDDIAGVERALDYLRRSQDHRQVTTIIAVVGPAGAGKSSIADHLATKYGARRYAFARPLKEIARLAFDLAPEQVYGTQAQKEEVDPRYNRSARWILQRLGTEGVRAVLGQDFWTRMTMELIKRDAPALAVIEDARFSNECAIVREGYMSLVENHFAKSPGYVWRVLPPPGHMASTDDGTHASEREWREATCDAVIQPQQRGLPELFAHVDDLCQSLHLLPVEVVDAVRAQFPARRELPL
jgi:hypothetical protein